MVAIVSPVTCPDDHKCHNGGVCKEDPDDEGSFYCDCSLIAHQVFAGLSCEHEASSFCNNNNETSSSSYCTNGGKCVKNTDESSGVHFGCECGDAYKGDHCEFLADQTVPDDYGPSSSSSSTTVSSPTKEQSPTNTNHVGAVAGSIIAIAVLVLAVLGALIWRRRKSTKKLAHTSRPSTDLQLEADGSTLRDVKIDEDETEEETTDVI